MATINDVCIENGIDFTKAKTRNDFKRFIKKEQGKVPSIALLYKKAYRKDITDAFTEIQSKILAFDDTDTKLTHVNLAKKRHLSEKEVITSRILLTHLRDFIGYNRIGNFVKNCCKT